jgi:hypothetical protein
MKLIEKTIKDLELSIASVDSYGGGDWQKQNMIQDTVFRNAEEAGSERDEASVAFDAVLRKFNIEGFKYKY